MKTIDLILKKIISKMQDQYGCPTVILYGSHARREATETSDYDIIAIREKGETERDCTFLDNVYLDAFIYSEEAILNPDDSFIRMKDGIVLSQKDKIGDQLVERVRDKFSQGPRKLSFSEKTVIITWSEKMLKRAEVGDIEGNYRRHWLLYDLLEAYFQLRDQWYLGPKESLQWLKINQPNIYSLFDTALQPSAPIVSIKKLIENVTHVEGST